MPDFAASYSWTTSSSVHGRIWFFVDVLAACLRADAFHLGRTQASKDILTGLLSDEPDRAAEISLVLEAVIDGFWNEGHLNPKGNNPEELLATTLRCLATYLPEHREAILSHV